jgi:hypothetical protein
LGVAFCLLPSAFCLLPFSSSFIPHFGHSSK